MPSPSHTWPSRLFGTDIPPDAVIDETFERATDPKLKPQSLGDALADAVDADLPAALTDAALRSHPLAVWIELEIGLQDEKQLQRRRPTTLSDAAKRLAAQTKRGEERCRAQLQAMLMMMSRPASERGGTGERAFLAFKLHRFISGAGRVYATLRSPDHRRVTLDGQRFDPEDPDARLYPTFFCRQCGQEHHPVVLVQDGGVTRILPRPIDETPLEDTEDGEEAGYLMPEPQGDPDYAFTGAFEDYPEDWLETGPKGGIRLRGNRRRSAVREVVVDPAGAVGATGIRAWFLPGKFGFCPACKDQPPSQAREINKLASLSAEGRSSATTLLVSSALRWMNGAAGAVPADKRKLLGFTDNRQDAALQAGHFNDFLFVSLLRAATLAAVRKEGTDGLAEEDFGRRVQQALGFTAANQGRRQEWMLDPEAKGAGPDRRRAHTWRGCIAHRVWVDQRRGWRFTNPSLEELGLVRAHYVGLDELAADEKAFENGPAELRVATPQQRRRGASPSSRNAAQRPGGHRRRAGTGRGRCDRQCFAAEAARAVVDIPAGEPAGCRGTLSSTAPKKAEAGVRGEPLIVRGGPRSRLARQLGHPRIWGKRLDAKTYLRGRRGFAEGRRFLRNGPAGSDELRRRRLAARRQCTSPRRRRGPSRRPRRQPVFCQSLPDRWPTRLASGAGFLFGLEGREHTAQVDQVRREWREWRFRWGDGGSRTSGRRKGRDAPGRRARRVPAGAVLLADDGAWRRHLGAERGLSCATYRRPRPTTRSAPVARVGRARRLWSSPIARRRGRTTSIISSGPRRW